jgi:hypothetical protein
MGGPGNGSNCALGTTGSVGQGAQPLEYVQLLDPNDLDSSLQRAIMLMRLGFPVSLGFMLTGEFDRPDNSGYVQSDGQGSPSLGGHAVHLVGYPVNPFFMDTKII